MTTSPEALADAFQQGHAAGLDPDRSRPARGQCASDLAVTGLRSRWLHRRCRVCGHSFRLGDEVRVEGGGEAVHDMPGLRCHGDSPDRSRPADSAAQAEFFAGLTAAWPMPAGIKVVQLDDGHPLLAPPGPGRQRASCRVCGHSFRPADLVVICPCSPNAPRCRAAVHRDPLSQLHCWDEWAKGPGAGTCLGMS